MTYDTDGFKCPRCNSYGTIVVMGKCCIVAALANAARKETDNNLRRGSKNFGSSETQNDAATDRGNT